MRFDIPDDQSADVTRVHALRNTIFTRTRIVALILIMILALSVAGTLAYLIYTGNQTPNRFTDLDYTIRIAESSDGTTFKNYKGSETKSKADTEDGNQNSMSAGEETKQVKFKVSGNSEDPVVVRMSVTAQVEDKESEDDVQYGDDVKTFLNGTWSAPTTVDGKQVIHTDLVNIILADDWASNWLYKDGAFIYNKTVKGGDETPLLVKGVEWCGTGDDATYDATKHGKIEVPVFAEVISYNGATTDWGLTVASRTAGATVSLS